MANVIIIVFILVVILTVILPYIKSKLQKRYPTQVTAEEREQSPESRSREGSIDRENYASISSSRHCQIDQRVQGNESNTVEQGNLSSPAPEREPQTSKTVEDYLADPSFDIGHQASLN